MGDRYYRFFPCPKCGQEVEEYDAPSSLIFVSRCDNPTCGWKDARRYYEVSANHVMLGTKEEARALGGLVTCKTCGKEVMGSYIEGEKCLLDSFPAILPNSEPT